jgi:Uma2 family endonuclease
MGGKEAIRMTSVQIQRKTRDEFLALPEGPPYFEFDAGEIIPVTSPTIDHQDIVDALVQATKQFVRERRSGRVFREVDVYLPDGNIYIPDFGFLAADRLDLISPIDHKIHGVPDLVTEVLSADEGRDRIRKFETYYRNGVLWYWIVSTSTLAIEEYHATPQGYVRVSSVASGETFRPGLFPDLEIDLAALLGITPDEPQTSDMA